MREPLNVSVEKSSLGRCPEMSVISTFHPDPSQLGELGDGENDRLASLTVRLLDGESSHPYRSVMRILSLDSFTRPALYRRTGTPYPSLIMPLSADSLAYVGLARPEGLQALLSFRNDPIQKALIQLIGEEQYNKLVQMTCYYTEGEYTSENASHMMGKLYALVFAAIKKLSESLAKLSEADITPIPLVTTLLEELSALKRPLFTFERAAMQLRSEALFIVPFLNVLGISPGSPILLSPYALFWLGPGDYLLLEFLSPESQSIVDNLLPWSSDKQRNNDLYDLVLQSTRLTVYLPRHYAFEYNGYAGELKYKALDMNIHEFEVLHNKNKLLSGASLFDSYTMTLKHDDKVAFSAHIHVVPVGNKAYNFEVRELGLPAGRDLYALLLRGICQLHDDKIIAPSYWRLTDLSPEDTIGLTPLGLATHGAISCVFLSLEDTLSSH